MIWTFIPSVENYRTQYQNYVTGLEGALAIAERQLELRNPRRSIVLGNQAIDNVVRVNVPLLSYYAKEAAREAQLLGSEHALGLPTDLSARLTEIATTIGEFNPNMDSMSATTTVRNQALAYDIAYKTMSHNRALAKATGRMGTDGFSQLDRANRRFNSVDLATGYVRLMAAHIYVDTFAEIANAKGVTLALLTRDNTSTPVELANLHELRQEYFHPNTRYELRLP